MEIWIVIGALVVLVIVAQKWKNSIKKDKIEIVPDKPNFPPPVPPPIPIYAITSVEKLTDTHLKRMQKELENHFFSNLARPHHKIPIIEPPKRKEETNETKENPTRKITY